MKPVKKGESWDVFESGGSVDGDMQIQRVDSPDVKGVKKFRSDEAAIRHVIHAARRGDAEAIEALWKALPYDGLLNRVLWCQAMQWSGPDCPAYPPGYFEMWSHLYGDES